MKSRRHRQPLDHVLVAGDYDDLSAIRWVLEFLPEEAYGQVLVELPAGVEPPTLTAPARVTVTWLPTRSTDLRAGVVLADRGLVLAEAIAGWFAEWMPHEPEGDREFSIWIGGRASEHVDALCAGLELQAGRL